MAQQPTPMSGELAVGIRVSPSGEPCISIVWPDGSGFLLPKGQALHFAFVILATVRNLFSSVEELNDAVLQAKAGVDLLAQPGDAETKDNRPVLQ
jgi:hypothetical protein